MATRVLPLVAEVGTKLCRIKLEGGSLGGYRCDILTENLSQREVAIFKCPRCEGIMKDGVISNTGEQLCVCCLREREQSHFNAPIRSTILSLKSSCPLFKRGCDWLGSLENVENHLTTCGHVHVSCELMCEVVTTRDGMGKHVREACSQREEACLHCSEVHKMCEMGEHVKVCGKVAVICELGCGTRVCRDSILYHKENECPEVSVVCPYYGYGCEVLGLTRRDLKPHLKESKLVHLELKLKVFDECNVLLRKENELLKSELRNKDHDIEILKLEIGKRTGVVTWCIKNISTGFKKNLGATYSPKYTYGGYEYKFFYKSDAMNFNLYFYPLQGKNFDSLEWPLRAIFTTKVICHTNIHQSLEMQTPVVEILKKDCGIIFSTGKQICSIPLSTDLKDFIRSGCLDVEFYMDIHKI